MSECWPLTTVLVTVKSDLRIYRLLDSLVDQSVPREAFEIIVVENGSSELRALSTDTRYSVRYFHTPTANMAAARNIGLNAADGTYLLTTDADVVVESDWIEKMVRSLSNGELVAVGGRIQKLNPRSWTQRHSITIVDGQTQLNYLPALHLPYVVGANAGFITKSLREVGGFDESLRSGNDVDVCYKLGLQGGRIGLAPGAVIFHEDRADLFGHFNRFRNYAVFQVLLFAKYQSISNKRFVVNPYPLKRTAQAIWSSPFALWRLAYGDVAPAAKLVLQIAEALGIWWGDIQGSVRFRRFYI